MLLPSSGLPFKREFTIKLLNQNCSGCWKLSSIRDVFNQEGGKVYAPASDFIPVDAEIPGCPPRPSEILEAILAVGPQAIANRGREKK